MKVSKNEDPGRKDSHMWLFRTGEYNTETPIVLYDFQNSLAGKANNLKPYEYLKHLLTEIPKRLDLKTSEYSLDDLLPWADAIPDCCRLKTK